MNLRRTGSLLLGLALTACDASQVLNPQGEDPANNDDVGFVGGSEPGSVPGAAGLPPMASAGTPAAPEFVDPVESPGAGVPASPGAQINPAAPAPLPTTPPNPLDPVTPPGDHGDTNDDDAAGDDADDADDEAPTMEANGGAPRDAGAPAPDAEVHDPSDPIAPGIDAGASRDDGDAG